MTFKTQVTAVLHCTLLEKGVPLYGVGWLRLMFRKTFQVLVIINQPGLKLGVSATPGHCSKAYLLVSIFLCSGKTRLCFPSPRNGPR